jgi:Na+/proline symporter
VDGAIVQVVLFSTLGIGVFSFPKLLRRVKEQKCSKLKAVGLYLVFTFMPVAAFVLLFLGFAGLEELTQRPLIGELLTRSLIIVVAVGALIAGVSSLAFLVTVISTRRSPKQELP